MKLCESDDFPKNEVFTAKLAGDGNSVLVV